MMVFYKELSLDEGYAIADIRDKHSRLVAGREVSLASGIKLFQAVRGQEKCWNCGCIADRWIVCKGPSDHGKPVLNLFASKTVKIKKHGLFTKLVMMTRDHIIPKSYGGKDLTANLRPGCEECNSTRGSYMNDQDKAFMAAHPELIHPVRAALGAERRQSTEKIRERAKRRRAKKDPK